MNQYDPFNYANAINQLAQIQRQSAAQNLASGCVSIASGTTLTTTGSAPIPMPYCHPYQHPQDYQPEPDKALLLLED